MTAAKLDRRAPPAKPAEVAAIAPLDDPCLYPDAWLGGPGDDFLFGSEPGPDLDPRADAPAPPLDVFDPGLAPLDDEVRAFELDLGIDPPA